MLNKARQDGIKTTQNDPCVPPRLSSLVRELAAGAGREPEEFNDFRLNAGRTFGPRGTHELGDVEQVIWVGFRKLLHSSAKPRDVFDDFLFSHDRTLFTQLLGCLRRPTLL